MRRHSVFKCIQKETELLLCLLFCKAEHIKHLALNVALEDTDTSSAELRSVQNDIIRFRAHSARISLQLVEILLHQHREWMMHRHITLFFLVPLKQRELCYPEEFKIILFQKSQILCNLNAERAEHVPDHFILVSRKQEKIPRLAVHCFYKGRKLFLRHKFCKGRFVASVLIDHEIRKSFCPVSLCKFYQRIYFLTRHTALSFCIDSADTSACCKCICKYRETAVLYDL